MLSTAPACNMKTSSCCHLQARETHTVHSLHLESVCVQSSSCLMYPVLGKQELSIRSSSPQLGQERNNKFLVVNPDWRVCPLFSMSLKLVPGILHEQPEDRDHAVHLDSLIRGPKRKLYLVLGKQQTLCLVGGIF